MSGNWLDHKELKIIKGVGKTPTDTLSAENDPVVVNLLDGIITLDSKGWSPNIPATKSGGVWADSPITDGRTLLAAPEGNVTEKMTIIIADRSYLAVVKKLSSLNQMVMDCRDYWQSGYQVDPVYLLWTASCGTGPALPQYALLSNIELVPEYQDGPSPIIQVSMTLEREVYWRGIPPSANPKLWAFYVNGNQIGTNKVLADATLVTGSDHLITQTIQNKFEWTPAGAGLQVTPLTQNWVDIPGSLIPGDAPALCEIAMAMDTAPAADIYIGRSSKKNIIKGHDNITRAASYILNVGDASVGSGFLTITAGSSNDSVRSNNSSVVYSYGKRTSTGIDSGFVNAATWGTFGTLISLVKLDRELMRGSFAIFVRAANQSASATLADMRMNILVVEDEDPSTGAQYTNSIQLPDVNPPISPNLGTWPLVYMGTLTLPFAKRGVQSLLGYGRQVSESVNNIAIILQQKVDVVTASRVFVALDLILMPVDEGLTQIVGNVVPSGAASNLVYDNTGYLRRGSLESIATGYVSVPTSGGVDTEVRGQAITLLPKTNQRLYFISDNFQSTGFSPAAKVTTSNTVRLNIVPRWSGIRDT